MRDVPATWRTWLPLAAFGAVLALLWYVQGPLTDKEALKYTGCARDLLQGNTTDLIGNYKGFAAYVLFLCPFIAGGLPMGAMVAQVVLGAFAIRALGAWVKRISASEQASFLAMMLASICLPWQQWTLALYSESFFTSVLVIFLERITRAGRLSAMEVLLAVVLLFARPVGLLFVGPALIWKAGASGTHQLPRWAMKLGYALVLVVAITLPGIPRDQITPIVEAHVICGTPERPGAMEGFTGSSIVAAQGHLFAAEPTRYVIGLFLRRIGSLFTLPRPYYSTGHNLFLSLYYALFILTIIGLWSYASDRVVRLILTMLMIYSIFIGLAHDEWSGRFLVPLWPLIITLAGLACARKRPVERR